MLKRSCRKLICLVLASACTGLLICHLAHINLRQQPELPQLTSPTAATIAALFGAVCHSPQCTQAMLESVAGGSKKIPPIRHILWKSERVSAYFARQLKTWSDIHPDWKYILWRDQDLTRFVAKHFTGALAKFQSLPQHIMRVDMVRYMILHKFGGVYADLDYILVRPLDKFLQLSAVVTRETEAHALYHFGMGKWPPTVLGNPAFMMSEPQHPFFSFCTFQLLGRPAKQILQFAGPLAVTDMLQEFAKQFPAKENPDAIVFVPPSRNFYPFDSNSLHSSTSVYKNYITGHLSNLCRKVTNTSATNLIQYCKDVFNLNPITDPDQFVFAVHDSNKSRSSYDSSGSPEFQQNLVNMSSVLKNLVMADTIF